MWGEMGTMRPVSLPFFLEGGIYDLEVMRALRGFFENYG